MKADRNTAEYLVKLLEEHGVEYVFGYPGEQVIPIYDALRKSKIKHILTRHEQAAVHAADSYARCSGKCGVCLVTAGPGAMNLAMGVSACFKDNVPVLVLTGDVPTDVKGGDTFQDLPLNDVFKPITVKSYNAYSPEKLENSINEAFMHFDDGVSGPFHINIPKDVQNKSMNISHKVIHTKKIKQPQESDILDVIKQIDESTKPLIIAGSGIIYADAIGELNEFVEKTGIPLTTTWTARGIITEKNEQNLGLTGNRGTEKANYAAEHADLILALGTRLSDRTTSHITTQNIIQINTNPEHRNSKTFYNNNIREFLENINKKEVHADTRKWMKRINSQTREKRKLEKTDKLHPEKVVQNILKHADKNTTITIDAGTIPTYFTIDSTLEKPGQILFSGGLGPMGYALPAAIGATYARPEDVILAVAGDGAIQMTIEELAVLNTYKLPIIVIIINNNLLGIIKQWQNMAKLPEYQVRLDNPDFVKLAESYNIEADNITSIDELNEKISEAVKKKKPHLFNIEVADVPIPLP
ncbi:MAG: hypothetical protein BZ138_01070 [Methanosphaera sp. rholeuAM270]|nr:MAG: hypothetical protein BZ138_01070 [Methanosphaera sp. rholeuAM270]